MDNKYVIGDLYFVNGVFQILEKIGQNGVLYFSNKSERNLKLMAIMPNAAFITKIISNEELNDAIKDVG
jgi:hypothetical protein